VHKVEQAEGEAPGNANDSVELEAQKLPKIKITRLQTKRTLIQTKDTTTPTATPTSPAGGVGGDSSATAAECSRPLRKRKRIIDCDFQKIALRELETTADETHNSNNKEAKAEVETEEEVCNINSNNSAKAKK